MARVESSGVAKAGLTTGIIGTSLAGLLALNGTGGLGGLFGGNRVAETEGAMALQSAALGTISCLQSQVGKLEAQRYADQGIANAYEKTIQRSDRNDDRINENLKEAFNELVITRERLARYDALQECQAKDMARMSAGLEAVQREVSDIRVREQATSDAINCLAKSTDQRFDAVYRSIDCAKRECGDAIALEVERRCAADQSLRCYVDARFVPGRLVMPKDSICPEVMPRYNTFATPTNQAPEAQPISGSVNVNLARNSVDGCGCGHQG